MLARRTSQHEALEVAEGEEKQGWGGGGMESLSSFQPAHPKQHCQEAVPTLEAKAHCTESTAPRPEPGREDQELRKASSHLPS